MCGGALEVPENATTAICDYCGSQQTLPKLNDEKVTRLYERANLFRLGNEFDKASAIYEEILNENSTDSEVYWSLVLCNYGIEYVEDPKTHRRMPTVNRAQFTSVFDDINYRSALKYADINQKVLYEQEAKQINEIQKGILEISQKEEPFDIFICYKETDEYGRRTRDSVTAQELYYQLTDEGFKVFFARITLEGKLGVAYEPYIFAALNSAKIMVVLGSQPEYFNAVWVKNEWSRYLSIVKQSGGKKMLIPAYKDMDPYNLPEEFSHLQAQDMSKLGFMQDLIRGIKKIIPKETAPQAAPQVVYAKAQQAPAAANTDALLRRTEIFLKDGNFSEAIKYCEKVLDINPECGKAYLYKLMARAGVANEEQLANFANPLSTFSSEYRNALEFCDVATADRLRKYNVEIQKRIAEQKALAQAKSSWESGKTKTAYQLQERLSRMKSNSVFKQISATENAIATSQRNLETLSNQKPLRKLCISLLLLYPVFIALAVIGFLAWFIFALITTSLDSSGFWAALGTMVGVVLLSVSVPAVFITNIVLTFKILKKANMPIGLMFLFILTYIGIMVSLICAIVALSKCKKSKLNAEKEKLSKLQQQLNTDKAKIEPLLREIQNTEVQLAAVRESKFSGNPNFTI